MIRSTLLFGVTATMLAAVLLVGCKTSEPGVNRGLVGEVIAQIASDPESVAAAAEQVLTSMNMADVETTATAVDAEVTARSAKKKIRIDIDRAGDNVSSVKIKAGLIGDEALGLEILKAMKEQLGG